MSYHGKTMLAKHKKQIQKWLDEGETAASIGRLLAKKLGMSKPIRGQQIQNSMRLMGIEYKVSEKLAAAALKRKYAKQNDFMVINTDRPMCKKWVSFVNEKDRNAIRV